MTRQLPSATEALTHGSPALIPLIAGLGAAAARWVPGALSLRGARRPPR